MILGSKPSPSIIKASSSKSGTQLDSKDSEPSQALITEAVRVSSLCSILPTSHHSIVLLSFGWMKLKCTPKKMPYFSLSETNQTFKTKEPFHWKKSTNSANKKILPICSVQRNRERKWRTFLLQWLENCQKHRALKHCNLHKPRKGINWKAIKGKNRKKAVAEMWKRNLCLSNLYVLSTFYIMNYIEFKDLEYRLKIKIWK